MNVGGDEFIDHTITANKTEEERIKGGIERNKIDTAIEIFVLFQEMEIGANGHFSQLALKVVEMVNNHDIVYVIVQQLQMGG